MTAEHSSLFHRDPTLTYPVITKGKGIYLYDEEGQSYIDGTAGAGNVTLGHGRSDIAAVMAEQAETLAYCFSTSFTNGPALRLAERVATLAPGNLEHVYFVSGGSEGIETAFKMARQYHVQRGNLDKHQIISRWRGYHGATLGALAATGMPPLRQPFAPWLPNFPHISACYPYRCVLAGCEGKCNLSCAEELEQTILQVGPDNVAAFVAEPVVMAGVAVGLPPQPYFQRIRQICDRYDVLFIADEVITGFGRTGLHFAIEYWDVVPDMIVFGKGASSGYCPLGGVVVTDQIYDVFATAGLFLAHVFTYVNNPVAMRVGLEVLDIIESENILEHVDAVGCYLQDRASQLYRHRIVGDIRSKGLMLGAELVRDRETHEPFPATAGAARKLNNAMLKRGLSASTTSAIANWVDGDDLRLYPPLIITRQELDQSINIIDDALEELESELRNSGQL